METTELLCGAAAIISHLHLLNCEMNFSCYSTPDSRLLKWLHDENIQVNMEKGGEARVRLAFKAKKCGDVFSKANMLNYLEHTHAPPLMHR